MPILLAVILLIVPALASAQSSRSSDGTNTSLPTIGLPLPQIGLPLPPIGSSSTSEQPTNRGDRRSSPNKDRNRGGERRGGNSKRNVVVVPVPVYGWGYPAAAPLAEPAPADPNQPAEAASPEVASRPTGVLVLDLQPSRNAQLYVDEFYVGTTDELGLELTLDAGPHSVEVRTPGYEPVAVKVNVEAGRALTYRSALQALASTRNEPPAPAADAKPAAPKPVYFIPGCYLGNVPPKDAGLPATCDQSRARTIQPLGR